MGDLGESFAEEEDDFVPNYIAKTLVLGIRGTTKNKKTGVVVPNAKIVEIRTELEETEASNLDSLEGFNVCGDGEDDFQTGGACLWIIDEEKFNALPADQQGGFHNTQINANVAALHLEQLAPPVALHRRERGRGHLRAQRAPGEQDQRRGRLLRAHAHGVRQRRLPARV